MSEAVPPWWDRDVNDESGQRLRADGLGVRHLYGHRGHAPPGTQRFPHAAARGRGSPRGLGLAHAEGCHQ